MEKREKRPGRSGIWNSVWILFCACAVLLSGCSGNLPQTETAGANPLRSAISNQDAVIAALRDGLRNHSQEITVTFRYGANVFHQLSDLAKDWIEAALEETEKPTEGDYIRYQYGGYEITSQYEQVGEAYTYTVSIVPDYYMYLVHEEAVTARLRDVFETFSFDETTSDYEKIRTIYDYVCSHVRYDQVHKGSDSDRMRSTAYAALIWNTATCQGYCALLYRMLREAGIPCRIVTGLAQTGAGEEFHAWNIAALDGVYYALDATWDANLPPGTPYTYFLRGTAGLTDHQPGEAFLESAFRKAHPMAQQDYGGA